MLTKCALRYRGSSHRIHPFILIIFARHPRAKPVRMRTRVARGANERARGAQPFSRVVERRPVAVSGRAKLFFVVVVFVVVVVARARIVECSSWAHPG